MRGGSFLLYTIFQYIISELFAEIFSSTICTELLEFVSGLSFNEAPVKFELFEGLGLLLQEVSHCLPRFPICERNEVSISPWSLHACRSSNVTNCQISNPLNLRVTLLWKRLDMLLGCNASRALSSRFHCPIHLHP